MKQSLQTLNNMSVDALMGMVKDIRAQRDIGLLTSKQAHDEINKISVVVMSKQLKEQGFDGVEDDEYDIWREPAEGGQSVGDELMTNGWED